MHTPVVTIALLLAVLSASCDDTAATSETDVASAPSSTDPTILFQRSDTRRTHVALVGVDGSGESAPLTAFGDGDQTNPDWSPDGSRFVFAMTDGTTDDLYVAEAGAADARKVLDCVSPCQYLDDPAWSPDGDLIVYSRTSLRGDAAVSTLETVEVATGKTRVLLGPWRLRFSAGARWSPDGKRIVFELVQKTGPELEAELSGVTLSVLRLGSKHGALRSLTEPALFAATADWSPDGRWIVYSALASATASAAELFCLPASGGVPRKLTDVVGSGGYAAEPTFTPDSRSIVFSGGRTPEEFELLLRVSLRGTGLALATGEVEVHGRHPRLR